MLRSQVRSIVIYAGNGDDRITLTTDIPGTVVGGDGKDVLIGSLGRDTLYDVFQNTRSEWLVRLRNPWGVDGRDGALTDLSGEKPQSANDGLITLTWSQFTRNFRG